MTSKSAWLAAAAALVVSSPALAQDAGTGEGEAPQARDTTGQPADVRDEEGIVVVGQLARFGATKSNTPILETARSVSIETQQDFKDKGFLTLDDALGYTSGVTAEVYGFSTRGDFGAVRGLDVPQFRDNLQYLFGYYNNPRPELYTLEQVEVLKGPASVLYGAGSPGGIINTVTKRPFDGQSAEIVGQFGNFDRYEVATDLNTTMLDGTGLARFVGVYRNTGTQIDEVDEEKIVVAPAFTARPAEGTEITFLGNYTRQNTDTAHQFYPLEGTLLPHPSGREIDYTEYFGEPGFNRYDSESLSITVLGTQQITRGLSFEAVGRFVDSTADYWQSWPDFGEVGAPRTDAEGNAGRTFYLADNRSEQLAFDARLRGEFSTGPIRHELLAGVQVQDVMYDSDTAYLAGGGWTINVFDPVYGNAPTEAEMRAAQVSGPKNFIIQTGYYLSNQMTLGRLIVNGGVRFDRLKNRIEGTDTQRDNATTFSGGVLYRGPLGLSPYFSYAESFQPVVGLDTTTQERLKPQEGRQYEVGLKWQLPGTQAFVTVAGFDIEQSNLPNPQALVGGNSQQEGIAKIRGIEVEANANIGGLKLDANFTHLDHEDPNGIPLSSIPNYQASVFAIYRFSGALDGFRLGGGVRHIGSSESTGVSSAGQVFTYVTGAYTVGDAVVGYRFGAWDLAVNARNVTDKRYFTTCLARGDCYPGELRTVVATLGYRF